MSESVDGVLDTGGVPRLLAGDDFLTRDAVQIRQRDASRQEGRVQIGEWAVGLSVVVAVEQLATIVRPDIDLIGGHHDVEPTVAVDVAHGAVTTGFDGEREREGIQLGW